MLSSQERVSFWRKLRGLSQQELGDRCDPPMPQSKISRIESGKSEAYVSDFESIAKALGLSMLEFYGSELRPAENVA
jgi:transcriptional regulator with XRE-family HTH domain